MKLGHRHFISSSLAAGLAAAAILTPCARAQTGPWTDGEILMRSTVQATGTPALFRIDPETGETALLITTPYWGGWSGSMQFDSYRGGVLCNLSIAVGDPYQLWLVSHDGTSAALPGFTGALRALASAGDGRVFFVRHSGAAQGPKTIEYFDASDQLQTLKDTDGITPFLADVEHLLYDATGNALIGSSSVWFAATACGPSGASLYRFPLSADGLRVEGPVSCTWLPPTTLYAGEIMGFDHLPDGNVLVSTATGWLGAPHPLLSLNPVTLAFGLWAEPMQYDINGGIWSARLGKALVHADAVEWWEPDGLRTFTPGASGFGTYIPTSITLPFGGGFSPDEIMVEVDLNGPACDGFAQAYGAGLAGNGGVVPEIGAIGCPDIGSAFTVAISGVNGGAIGLLGFSPTSGGLPLAGGTLLIGVPVLLQPCIADGMPGAAGAGSHAHPILLGDPSLLGIDIFLQAGFLDAGAVQGISLTNGLRVQAG